MAIIVVERAHFEVVGVEIGGVLRGQMGFDDDGAQYMYDELGLICIYANLKLKCKVCGSVHTGFEATQHLQQTSHREKRAQLMKQVDNTSEWCEGCPMLIKESNPYYDVIELVCRLGFCHRDKWENEDGSKGVRIVYRIDDELWRPEMCKEKIR